MLFTTAIFFATVASFFSNASAIPFQASYLKARQRFPGTPTTAGPPITSPGADDVFLAGESIVVAWTIDESSEGDLLDNVTLMMGQFGPSGKPELTIQLGTTFFTVGNETVVIPSDTLDGKYIIVLTDTSNIFIPSISGEFSIGGVVAGAA